MDYLAYIQDCIDRLERVPNEGSAAFPLDTQYRSSYTPRLLFGHKVHGLEEVDHKDLLKTPTDGLLRSIRKAVLEKSCRNY